MKPVRAFLAAIAMAVVLGGSAAAEEVDLALVIATDTSRSIDEIEARLQREGVMEALRHPDIISAIQSGYHKKIGVTYIDYSSRGLNEVVVPWRVISDTRSAEAFTQILGEAPLTFGQRTSISDGLELAAKLLNDGTMRARRRVIDVSGDGPNNHGRYVDDVRDEIVAHGITINGLPIINERDYYGAAYFLDDLDKYYRGCVIGGPGAFTVVAKDFTDFARAIRRKLIFEIADTPPPAPDPNWSDLRVPVQASPGASPYGSGYVYEKGCDIGERLWQQRFDPPNP